MVATNLLFAWCWITLGLLSGAAQGLGFHRESHMGGYDSWPRRLTRLAHIAFLGTGMINLAYALTAIALNIHPPHATYLGALLILGAVSMPTVCYLVAWQKPFRQLFFVPVLSLTAGCAWFTVVLFIHLSKNGVLS